jgi:hypothetical protein
LVIGITKATEDRKIRSRAHHLARHQVLPRVLKLGKRAERVFRALGLGHRWVQLLYIQHKSQHITVGEIDHRHSWAALEDADQMLNTLVLARKRPSPKVQRELRELLEHHLEEHTDSGRALALSDQEIHRVEVGANL